MLRITIYDGALGSISESDIVIAQGSEIPQSASSNFAATLDCEVLGTLSEIYAFIDDCETPYIYMKYVTALTSSQRNSAIIYAHGKGKKVIASNRIEDQVSPHISNTISSLSAGDIYLFLNYRSPQYLTGSGGVLIACVTDSEAYDVAYASALYDDVSYFGAMEGEYNPSFTHPVFVWKSAGSEISPGIFARPAKIGIKINNNDDSVSIYT